MNRFILLEKVTTLVREHVDAYTTLVKLSNNQPEYTLKIYQERPFQLMIKKVRIKYDNIYVYELPRHILTINVFSDKLQVIFNRSNSRVTMEDLRSVFSNEEIIKDKSAQNLYSCYSDRGNISIYLDDYLKLHQIFRVINEVDMWSSWVTI